MFPIPFFSEELFHPFLGGQKRDEVEYGLADGFVRLGDYA